MTLYGSDSDEAPSAKKPKFTLPEGFDDEVDFLRQMRKDFYDDIQCDKLNRDAGIEDLKFFIGDQWDPEVRGRRQDARKPTLTLNRLIAFVAQIIGNRRLNETVIKVLPDNGGQAGIAKIREGLIRSIQKISRAELAYDKAMEGAAIAGIGNFQVALNYASDDVFEQEIQILPINDHFAVLWDRMITDLTGADADHVFVVDTYAKEYFSKRWPWATPADVMTDYLADMTNQGWVTESDVRVVSYHRMCTKKRTLALMTDGSTQDITEIVDHKSPTYDAQKASETLGNIVPRPDGSPIMRESDVKYCETYLCSGQDILDGPYVLPISRPPVFRVPGWEVNVGEVKHRFGLVRFLKDPLRIHNFSRSVLMEKMMAWTRARFLASKESVQGLEKDYRNSNVSDDPLLTYNGETGAAPTLIPPQPLEAAWLQLSEVFSQDIKDISNIHEANLGMPSNEVSGAAITARQRVSDTGTVLYHDNLNQAIEQCGKVIDELINVTYDTPRIIKVLGQDDTQDLMQINAIGPDGKIINDITQGKYVISISTGPSYTTKRIEAAQSMMSFINACPQIGQYTMDLVAKNMDWPGADEFARRIAFTLPPGMIGPKDMTPELQQHLQGQQQQAQQQQQIQQQQLMLAAQKMQSETALNSARARNFEAEADAIPVKLQTAQTGEASQAADRELRGSLEAIKVAHGA